MKRTVSFFIPGNIPGKARPVVTKNGTFMPKEYTTFKKYARGYLPECEPLETPLFIEVLLVGSHGSDTDNIEGTLSDIITENGLLVQNQYHKRGELKGQLKSSKPGDDSSKQLPQMNFKRYEHSDLKLVLVTMTEIESFTIQDFINDTKNNGKFEIVKHLFKDIKI